MIFGIRKLESWGYRAALFSRLIQYMSVHTQTDRDKHTHRHMTTAYNALSIAVAR